MIDCIKQGGGQLPLGVQIQMCHMLELLSKLLFFFHIQMRLMKYKYSVLKFQTCRVKFKCFILEGHVYNASKILFYGVLLTKKEHITNTHNQCM